MNITVVIINYGDMPRTLEYINDFVSNIDDTYEITFSIVENKIGYSGIEDIQICSKTDDIIENNLFEASYVFMYTQYKCVYTLASDNLGFARGNNLGAKIAHKLFHCEFFCFSNNDICFKSKICLSDIKKIFDEKDYISVVGPEVIGLDNIMQSPCEKKTVFAILFLWYYNIMMNNHLIEYCGNVKNDKEAGECYWVSGCFMFVRSKDFFDIDGFDNETFLYGEEMILAERLLKKGKRMFYYPVMKICHETSQSVSSSFARIQSIKFDFDSRLIYCRKYRNTSGFVLGLAKLNFALFRILFGIECLLIKILRRFR